MFFLSGREGTTTKHYFSSLFILSSLGKTPKQRSGKLSLSFIILPLLLFIVALTRPQWTENFEKHKQSGVDIVLAIDVSKSMEIRDFELDGQISDRLTVAKKIAKNFIHKRSNDRIGVVAFAGQPYRVSPITMTHTWLGPLIDSEVIYSESVTGGTAIGSAISSASNLLISDAKNSISKLIILITDGSSNKGLLSPEQAAINAEKTGIKVYTLGIGTEGGRLNGRVFNAPTQEFDTAILEKIAKITDGEFFRAKSTESLEASFAMIDKLEKTEVDVLHYKTVKEFHFLFSAFGLSLIVLYFFYYYIFLLKRP